jgi:uncharacterized RDD family membrane protein YckC
MSRGKQEDLAVRPAGMVRRAAALCVDAGILLSVVLWLGRGYRQAGLWSGLPNETLWFYPVAGVMIVLAYQFLFLAALQATPGMVFLGLSLADDAGDRVGPGGVAVRVAVSVVSVGVLGLGYLWALLNRRRQTWHDLAAGTMVIRGSARAARRRARPPRPRVGPRTYDVG